MFTSDGKRNGFAVKYSCVRKIQFEDDNHCHSIFIGFYENDLLNGDYMEVTPENMNIVTTGCCKGFAKIGEIKKEYDL